MDQKLNQSQLDMPTTYDPKATEQNGIRTGRKAASLKLANDRTRSRIRLLFLHQTLRECFTSAMPLILRAGYPDSRKADAGL